MTIYSGNVYDQLNAAMKAINSGEAKLEQMIIGAGDESFGSWETVLVDKDGTIFPDVTAKSLGNGQFELQTSAPASYGNNAFIGITTSANPDTGYLEPVKSQDQLKVDRYQNISGGGLLDSVVENTIGKVNEWIDGDPIKAAIIFASLAAGVPPLESGGAAAGSTAATTGATAGEAAATTAAAENAAIDQALIDLSAGASPEIATADLTASEVLSGIDLGGVGASPNTMIGGGEYLGSVPAAIPSYIPAGATEFVPVEEPLSGVDLGGRGASPNTMLGDSQYLDTVPAAVPSVSQITSDISGDNIDAGGGWSPATGATDAELAAARTAMASSGMTLSEALNYVRAGLLVNAITGDPLGLGGGGGGGGGNAPTGFAQVPIPAEWKSPEYSYTPVQNVTFEDLFPGVSLQGTQWKGLQNAKPSMTFNDIFASGMQQTPMGSPVDINQIVSAIVGQNAKI